MWIIGLTTKLIERYVGEAAAAASRLLDEPITDRALAFDAFVEQMQENDATESRARGLARGNATHFTAAPDRR